MATIATELLEAKQDERGRPFTAATGQYGNGSGRQLRRRQPWQLRPQPRHDGHQQRVDGMLRPIGGQGEVRVD